MPQPRHRVLSVFSLVMINIIAVDNLRSLPISAQYGFSLVFFYIVSALVFFIPSALVSAELATGWPNTGGVYIWVREAFGKRWGFLVIWLQWIYNVVWYPTILAFLAGIIAYLIPNHPHLADSKIYMLAVILSVFWLATIVNIFGMKASSFMSTLGTLGGTIVPMLFIAGLGIAWFVTKKTVQIKFSWASFLPDVTHYNNLAFLTGVLFGLMGMEMSAVHAEEVINPQRDYPRALLYSTTIILGSLILASLAIAIVVPHAKISLVTGLIQAFGIFFKEFHMTLLLPVIGIAIVIGTLGSISAWVIGPTKGLLVASHDGSLPPFFQKVNSVGVPVALLFTQAIIVTILSGVFLLMPTVNSSYWLLSVLTSQLALIFYIVLFAAAIKLRYTKPDQQRDFTIPGGKAGIWLVSGMGIVACVAVISFGFFPPPDVQIGNIYFYEGFLVLGILIFCLIPFTIYWLRKPKWVLDLHSH
jgi:putative glutamate/gamma-aminobutyrate antiporter